MRRRHQRLLAGAAVLSMVLWLGTAGAWAASRLGTYRTTFHLRGELYELVLHDGSVEWGNDPRRITSLARTEWQIEGISGEMRHALQAGGSNVELQGIERRLSAARAYERRLAGAPVVPWSHSLNLIVPSFIFAALTSALLVWLRRGQLAARAAGFCRSCEYDLRGNLSGVCPECGSPVAAAPPAAPG